MTEEDVVEMLGPIEDPSIADCLIALALPASVPGCTRLAAGADEAEAMPR